MNTQNNTVRNVVLVTLIAVALGAGYWFMQKGSDVLPVASGDRIESWDFQGSHNDGGVNEQKARDEITRLEVMLEDAETEPTDYALYVGIANQYNLLGDGRSTYNALGKALHIDAEKTGLAWHNMGSLMERLGAFNTARIAYDRAVEAQPVLEVYHIARFEFLLKHFPNDTEAIENALQVTEDNIGKDDAVTLQLRYEWLKSQGKNEEAEEVSKQLKVQLGIDLGTQTIKTIQ